MFRIQLKKFIILELYTRQSLMILVINYYLHCVLATPTLDRYMEIKPGIPELLSRLKSAGKKLFLLTNSPFWFV